MSSTTRRRGRARSDGAASPSLRAAAALLAFGLAAGNALALDRGKALTQYVLESWGARDGLRQHSIAGVAQTADGYLWLATEDGLVRFDGARFTTYNRGNSPGFGHDYLYAVLDDGRGSLWAATYRGLTRLKDGAFTTLTEREGLAGSFPHCIAREPAGGIWAGGYRGLSHVDGLRAVADPRFLRQPVGACLTTSDGSLWLAVRDTLERVRGTGASAERETIHPGAAVSSMTEGAGGTLWLATARGLGRLSRGKLRYYTRRDGLSSDVVRAVVEDRDGNLWVGTNAGLNRREGEGFRALTSHDGLSDDTVTALFEDREGSLWIGTQTGGLSRLGDGPCATFGRREGLPVDFVRTVLETHDGSLWFGTTSGGVGHLKEGRLAVYTTRDGLPSNKIAALGRGRRGDLWIGTSDGLARLEAGRFRRYGREDGLGASVTVTTILEDSKERLWVGSAHGLYRRDGGRFVQYTPSNPAVRRDPWVGPIIEGHDGSLWVGTDAGLWRLHGETLTVYGPKNGLPEEVTGSLLEDPDGTLWAGTSLSGLVRLKDGRPTSYRTSTGLLDDAVYSIVDDGRGRLWLTGDRGLYYVRRSELDDVAAGRAAKVTSHAFDRHDGLRVPEGNGGYPAGVRASDGRLWFATAGGAVVVNPRGLELDPSAPAVLMEEVLVSGTRVAARDGMRIGPGVGRLEIHYTATSLRVPERVRFRVLLEGLDAGWNDAGNRRVAYYTNLPPRRYRFRVAAADEDGVWNESGAALAFELAPYFHQTLWFRALCGLAAIGAALGLHRVRLRRLEARESELARRVKEAVAQIEVLSGLLPICASCKKIRDDQGGWTHVESYIAAHSRAAFSHGICPDCLDRLYPEYADKVRENLKAPPQ